MEDYINYMVVKSKRDEDHLRDLQKGFNLLDKYNMKLNHSNVTLG